METKYISKNSLKRLPFYMNYLKEMKLEGRTHISSTVIAKGLSLNDVQVRKDLALVSRTGGKPKIGYEIDELINDIELFLGCRNNNLSILVGVGSLGHALLGYKGFEEYGLSIVGAFDANEKVVGTLIKGVPVMRMSEITNFCAEKKINIAIITVPAQYAQEVCDVLVEAGIKAIWNFAPTKLDVNEDIIVQNENMASSLAILSRHLNEKMKKN